MPATDKKKEPRVFNPYDPKGKLAQRQRQMTDTVLGAAKTVASPVVNAASTLVGSVTAPAAALADTTATAIADSRVGQDYARQAATRDARRSLANTNRTLGNAGDNTRDALAQQTATAARVAPETPVTAPTPAVTPQNTSTEAPEQKIVPTERVFQQGTPGQEGSGTLTLKGERGGTDRQPVGPDGLPLNRHLGLLPPNQQGKVSRDGYTFGGKAGDAAKFFAPTGKGDPEAERNRALQHQQWLARQPQPRQFAPQQSTADNLGPESGWFWRGRQNAEAVRQGQQKIDVDRQNAAATQSLAARKLGADAYQSGVTSQLQAERNAIDAANTRSQMDQRVIENEGKQLTNKQMVENQNLIAAYEKEKDPANKQEMMSGLVARGIVKAPSNGRYGTYERAVPGGQYGEKERVVYDTQTGQPVGTPGPEQDITATMPPGVRQQYLKILASGDPKAMQQWMADYQKFLAVEQSQK